MLVKKFNENNIEIDIEKVIQIIKSLWGDSLNISSFSEKYFSGSRGYLLVFLVGKEINNKSYKDYMEFFDIINKTDFSMNKPQGTSYNFIVSVFVNKKFAEELALFYNAKNYNL